MGSCSIFCQCLSCGAFDDELRFKTPPFSLDYLRCPCCMSTDVCGRLNRFGSPNITFGGHKTRQGPHGGIIVDLTENSPRITRKEDVEFLKTEESKLTHTPWMNRPKGSGGLSSESYIG